MQSILTSVSNARWVNEKHTRIDCEITTSQFGDEVLPFTADKDDVEAHGRAIFEDLVSGKYGPIGAYVPPPPITASVAVSPTSNEVFSAE